MMTEVHDRKVQMKEDEVERCFWHNNKKKKETKTGLAGLVLFQHRTNRRSFTMSNEMLRVWLVLRFQDK